jgi:hypothetical protein
VWLAGPRASRRRRYWIPAFAGMTKVGLSKSGHSGPDAIADVCHGGHLPQLVGNIKGTSIL